MDKALLIYIGVQALTTALHVLHPRLWVALDVKRFVANGAKDSLRNTFHRQRATWRTGITMTLAVAAAFGARWGLDGGQWPFVLTGTGSALFGFLWFAADFNPRLNVARNLPYVGKWHVSWSGTSDWDTVLWNRAWKKVYPVLPVKQTPDPEVIKTAAGILQRLTVALYWASAGLHTIFIIASLVAA